MGENKFVYVYLGLGLAVLLASALFVWGEPVTAPGPVACTEEAKLCSDGSAVGRSGPNCEFAACPEIPSTCSSPATCGEPPVATTTIKQIIKDDILRVNNLQSGQLIKSPMALSGQARGPWYFEASFPIILLDGNGQVLTQVIATAQADWMTTNFVPFTANLSFAKPSTKTGTLVFSKDNPSGLPENADTLDVPVRFE